MGTTHQGQDVMSQLILGTRSVLVVGFVAGTVATVIGVLVGVTAGYIGGIGDESPVGAVQRLPGDPAAAAHHHHRGPAAVGRRAHRRRWSSRSTGWAWGARVLRAQTLSLRRRDFVEAARANGESTWRIITAEILPNLTAIIAAGFVGTVGFAVLSQITLSFVGITPTNEWNWGTVLYWAQAQLALQRGAWWWFVPAGLLIALLGMALTLINFGIDEFVNPRLRSRRPERPVDAQAQDPSPHRLHAGRLRGQGGPGMSLPRPPSARSGRTPPPPTPCWRSRTSRSTTGTTTTRRTCCARSR